MLKPTSLTNSFDTFLKLCRVYCNQQIQFARLEALDEAEVFAKLAKTREDVHAALCDDFDTCAAISSLFELVSFMNKKVQFQPIVDTKLEVTQETAGSHTRHLDLNRHYGCIMSVCLYVERILQMFGLQIGVASDSQVVELKVSNY